MKLKTVERIYAPKAPHFVGDGFRVHNFIPSAYQLDMQRMDPFIMLDYNSKHYFSATDSPRGVGVHPHRGFETVTIAYKGRIAHHDSAGNSGVIGEGEVQWMTAASGILHKEYHEREFSKNGGDFQMVQLWVNLPSVHKMSAPKYQEITSNTLKKLELPDQNGSIEIISGEYEGNKGTAQTFTPVHLHNIKLNNGGKAAFNFPAHFNTAMLVIEGEISVNDGEMVKTDHLVLMANDGEQFVIKATSNAKVLLLSGEPINEPIAAHGPFVMNSKEELIQAFDDFNTGKFGYLED